MLHAWITSTPRSSHRVLSSRSVSLFAAEDTSEDERPSLPDMSGKTLYQRVFYRFSPGSEVDVKNAIVVEERVRFRPDPERETEGYVVPFGHRTMILRDGQVEDGEIGDEFFVLDVHDNEFSDSAARTHSGAGMDPAMDATIVTAMYLASNPSLCTGDVLQLSCDHGLAALLGCIGAGYVTHRQKMGDSTSESKPELSDDVADDILTVPKEVSSFPEDLKLLTLSDSADSRLNLAVHNVKNSRVPASQVSFDEFDWRIRHGRGGASMGLLGEGGKRGPKEYHTIVASDVAFSFPEAKELARTVANRLEPSYPYLTNRKPRPRFVYVSPDNREETPHLQRLLEKGYRMNVSPGYLKLEKLTFVFQSLPNSEPESKLDDLDLELQQFKETTYESLVADHSTDYAGEGSGELFFPMENGAYDSSSGNTFLEPDPGRGGFLGN